MALDVAEFLWNKISEALEDAISEFRGHSLSPNFKAIKDLMSDENRKGLCSLIASETPAEVNMAGDKLARPSKFAVFYDLDDVLADCRIFARQCEELNRNLLRFNFVSKYFVNVRKKNQLKAIEDRLKSFISEKPEEEGTNSRHFPTDRQTYPSINAHVIGFDNHLKQVQGDFIGNNRFKAFGIYGMAGAGKTTLAQMVFQSTSVVRSFKRRIWVCLSDTSSEKDENLGSKIVKCILEELDFDFDALPGDVSLNELLGELYDKLGRDRYLIVLDDLWLMDEFYANLNNCTPGDVSTRSCLSEGLPKEGGGGVVLVTSRSHEVAKHVVGEDNLLDFSRSLNEEDCWKLFDDAINDGDKEGCSSYSLWKIKEEIEYQCHSLPLAAKALAQIIPQQIKDFEKDRLLNEFYIRDDILKRGLYGSLASSESSDEIPLCPVLMFLNTETGGYHEKELYAIFCRHLNKNQVFDLSKVDPNEVLHDIYGSLERSPRDSASDIKKKLKIVVVGGDVVANGILGVVSDMKLQQPPSIASVPHGSENNIPLSFGWGKEPLKADRESVESFLKQIKDAEARRTDSWHISIQVKVSIDSVAHEEIPRALHMFHPVLNDEKQIKDKYGALRGGFWNYFMIGTPIWSGVGCFGSPARTFSKLVTVQIKERERYSSMKDLHIPSSVRSIFCLNLHRFPGGLNPWRIPTSREEQDVNNQSGVQPSSFIDDGLLEIIGSRDGFLPGTRHDIPFAQVEQIRFLFKGTTEHLNISIDGALWEKIPVHGIESINISHFGQIDFLALPCCEAKSIPVPNSSAFVDHGNRKDDLKPPEIRRKFGAGSTFKRPFNPSLHENVNQ